MFLEFLFGCSIHFVDFIAAAEVTFHAGLHLFQGGCKLFLLILGILKGLLLLGQFFFKSCVVVFISI